MKGVRVSRGEQGVKRREQRVTRGKKEGVRVSRGDQRGLGFPRGCRGVRVSRREQRG